MEKQHIREEQVGVANLGGDELATHEGVGQWNEEGHGEPLVEDTEEAILSDTRPKVERAVEQ